MKTFLLSLALLVTLSPLQETTPNMVDEIKRGLQQIQNQTKKPTQTGQALEREEVIKNRVEKNPKIVYF